MVFSMSVALDLLKASSSKSHLGLVSLASDHEKRGQEEGGAAVERLLLGWPELESVLPDRGLPRGVVELAAPGALGGATRVALAAVRGGQERGAGAWCAWLDPEGSLYAPGVAQAAVDLQRLLVVRPPRRELAAVTVKLVQSRAFEVVVVDYAPPALVRPLAQPLAPTRSSRTRGALRPEVLVRKLALLADEGGCTVILLTDSLAPRPMTWPVALRLELSRSPGALTVKVAKDRYCRLATGRVAWPPRAGSRMPSLAPSLTG